MRLVLLLLLSMKTPIQQVFKTLIIQDQNFTYLSLGRSDLKIYLIYLLYYTIKKQRRVLYFSFFKFEII